MNAIMHAVHRNILDQELGSGWVQYWVNSRFSEPVKFWVVINATRSGRDPTNV